MNRRRHKPPLKVFTPESARETAEGWVLHTTRRRRIHDIEARSLDRRRYCSGAIGVALTAIIGSSAFVAWQTGSKNTGLAVWTGIAVIGATVVANVLTFLDLGGRAETHRKAAVAYKDLLRDFEEAFGLKENGSLSFEVTLSKLKSQLFEVDRTAPTVPVRLASKIERQDYKFATQAEELAVGGARARLAKVRVKRADENPKTLTASGEVTELWNDKRDPALAISRVLVKPKGTAELDALDIDTRYVITEGQGSVRLESGKVTDVAVGCVVAIPAHIQRQIINTHDKDNLVYYRICSPRLKPQRRRLSSGFLTRWSRRPVGADRDD